MNQQIRSFFKNKWVIGIGIALAVLIVAVFAFSQFFFQPWLRNKLQTDITEKSNGIYKLHMGSFHASLLGGTLTIDNLALLPDSAKWMQLNKADQPELTSRLTELKAGKLKLSGINYLGLWLNKPLNLSRVTLVEPVLHINQMKEDTTSSEPLHQGLEGPLKNMKVKKIKIENGTISYKKDYRHKYNSAEATGLNLEVNDLKLDSASYQAEDRVYYAKHFKASAGKTNLLSQSAYDRFKTGAVTIDSDSRLITLKSFVKTPVYNPAELARRKGEATNWIEVKVPEIVAEQVDFGQLVRNGNVVIGNISFKSPRMKAFKDKLNFTPKTTRPLPHDLVQQFKSGLDIGTIKISNMNIRYDELGKDAERPGHMEFYNLNATITNLNNDKNRMSAKNPAVAKLSFSIEGKSTLNCTIRLLLLDKNGHHTITGTVGKSDLTAMNSIIEPAYFVSFKSGTIQKGNFNLQLNRHTATGKVQLTYSDFEIDLLNKSEDKKQSLPKKALSKIANKVVVKEDNQPEPGGEGVRTADINVTRQKNRSVFTYWKDCLEQGLLVSAGLGNFQPGK